MKITAIFCILLVVSQTAYLRKGIESENLSPMEQLEKVKSINDFASNMVANVQLHLQTGGKVDEVINFVKEALADSQSALNDLRNESQAEEARLEGLLTGYQDEIDRMNSNFTITVNSISDLNQDISNLKNTVQRLQGDLDSLNTRENALNEARNNDEIAYQARQQRDEKTIEVLGDIILPALQNLVENGAAFLEKSERDVQYALKHIPQGNSLQAFVEITTQFNEAKVRTVISKLQDILANVQVSKQQDYQEEVRTKAKFGAMIGEINRIREYKGREISEARAQLQQSNQQLDSLTSKRDNLVDNIQQTKDIRDATQTIKDNTIASFAQKTSDATGAVQALKAALNILTENESTLQEQAGVANADTGA